MTSVPVGHIIPKTDPTSRERASGAGNEPTSSIRADQVSCALPTELPPTRYEINREDRRGRKR